MKCAIFAILALAVAMSDAQYKPRPRLLKVGSPDESGVFISAGCTCTNFISNKTGEGNCEDLWEEKLWCYVIQPSNCKDLVDSKSHPGKKWSRSQACKERIQIIEPTEDQDHPELATLVQRLKAVVTRFEKTASRGSNQISRFGGGRDGGRPGRRGGGRRTRPGVGGGRFGGRLGFGLGLGLGLSRGRRTGGGGGRRTGGGWRTHLGGGGRRTGGERKMQIGRRTGGERKMQLGGGRKGNSGNSNRKMQFKQSAGAPRLGEGGTGTLKQLSEGLIGYA